MMLKKNREIKENQFSLINPLPESPRQDDLIEMINSVGTLSLSCLNENESEIKA